MKVILAIDLGTTGNRVIAFSQQGEIIASAYYEFPQIYPKPAWVEHDPEAIWATTSKALNEVTEKVGKNNILAIGITNQRETTILWNKKTGNPIYNAIVWQCRRTAKMCQDLKSYAPLIKEKTGLFLDAYFSATKIKWILDNVPTDNDTIFGTVDSWILWKLTGVHATDVSNASRTMLFNIHTLDYDDELLKLFGVPRHLLPEVQDSDSDFGGGIVAILGDQQAALYGQGAIKNTYGTGLFLVANTGDKIPKTDKLINTIAWKIKGKVSYALEGSVFVGGSAVQWLRDGLQIIEKSGDTEALMAQDNGGVYFVPALVGLGAPYWNPDARGLITGLTRGTTRGHIIRATLESMAYQTRDVIEAMDQKFDTLCVDGGASANNFLMQFQADILNMTVERPKILESTAFGVARLAGVEPGARKIDRVFKPSMSERQRKELYDDWKKAIKLAIV